jgi:tRNA A-37 threonylcarbamoyl transferase component Bud32/uncharacterized RDD family membrane protein YckC
MSEDTKRLEEVKLKVSDSVTRPSPDALQSSEFNLSQVETLYDVKISDDFEVLEFIGKGGTGQVYKVREKTLDRIFAVKVLRKDLIVDVQTVKRFIHEAETAAKLSHPNVVSVYGHGETIDGSPFITMNYIAGENFAQTLKREHSLSWQKTVELFIQICEGLEHAHQEGLIHRDLKPSNILVSTTDGIEIAHIVDFGIAKVVASRGDTLNTLTVSGEFLGTPMYMSPEQCLGQNVDKRTDIYALGCLMYEALSGAGPFAGASSVEMIAKKMSEESPVLKAENIPPSISTIVACCMARQASDRYSDIVSLKQDLQAALKGASPKNAQVKAGIDKMTGGKRILAAILDYAIVTTVTGFVNIISLIALAVLAGGLKDGHPARSITVGFLILSQFVLPPLLTGAYYIVFEKIRGATLGKQLCALSVTDAVGSKLSWSASCLRNTMKFVFTLLFPFSGLFGFALPQPGWGLLTTSATLFISIFIVIRSLIKQRRLPWDVIAGTQVRRR